MFMTLNIPPGVFANGTELQAAGRWRDTSLVRWHEGAMQPVGGWQDRTDASNRPDNPARGIHAWWDNSGSRHIAISTHNKVFHLSATGTITEITPASVATGQSIAAPSTGFGQGSYGAMGFGTARPASGAYTEATTWTLDNYGENLVACGSADGRLLEWDLDTANDLTVIAGAPTNCSSLLVTEGRFLVALGAGGDRRKVQWSDREDSGTWTPSATNEAGDFLLQAEGQIRSGLRVRGQTLILTDRDAHTMTENGSLLVFSFERVGASCGVISRRAAVPVDGGAYWMGTNGFHRFNGGAVEDVPCDVSDLVFGDINRGQASIVHAVENSDFNEVWWFYPSASGSVADRYVAYNYLENHWMTGSLERAACVDRGVFESPIWVEASGVVYNQETGLNFGGETSHAETGPLMPADGETSFSALELLPDEGTAQDVTVTFKTRFYPNASEEAHGPYTMAAPTSVRFTGRQMRLRVDGPENTDWRWGVPRVRTAIRGRR